MACTPTLLGKLGGVAGRMPDFAPLLDLLKYVRRCHARRPEVALWYAQLALGHNRYILRMNDVDKWAIVEQAFLAALDLHEFDLAVEFLAQLERK